MRLFDRSRSTCDWTCPRKRYWQYEFKGKGIVSDHTHLPLYMGTAIHDGLAAIATQYRDYPEHMVDIDLIASTAHKQMMEALLLQTSGEVGEVDFASEQATLVEGLLRGLYKHVWPKLLDQYPTIIAIEEEVQCEVSPGLIFMSKPDLVLADREGNWVYVEYKSTASKSDSWINSWAKAVQLHSTVKAIEETLGTSPTMIQVVGLYKGYASYGKQNSPLCYCYKRTGQPPFSVDQTIYEYKAGFKRFPTWELEGGVKGWIEGMPESILGSQFPLCPPIMVNEDLVNNFFHQRVYREKEIELALQMMEGAEDEARIHILNCSFPQKFDACSPAYGSGCEYTRLCFGRVEDPLQEGFQVRESHHQLEREQDHEEVPL